MSICTQDQPNLRVKELEEKLHTIEKVFLYNDSSLFEKFNYLENRLEKIEKVLEEKKGERKPHRCILCEGVGKLWEVKIDGHPVYGELPRECHACSGKGILWG